MSYEILRTAEGLSILHITRAGHDSFTAWKIEFHDGKEAVLSLQNGKWLQDDEQWLDGITLLAIGHCIDNCQTKRSIGIAKHYFYEMLIN
jgi:hypothetical protein